MVEVTYTCPDGTPFPVTFDSEADAKRTWRAELEHSPHPAPPLEQALSRSGWPGVERAYGEYGLPAPVVWRDATFFNGFSFFPADAFGPETMMAMMEGVRALIEKYGGSGAIWNEHLAKVRVECKRLQDAPPSTPLAQLAEDHAYTQQLTMISAFVAGNDMRSLATVCEPVYPGQGQIIANELARGYDNVTIAADQRLWELGRMVEASPALRAALDAADPAAAMAARRAAGADGDFFSALDAYLDEYGWRAMTWEIASPTWREQGPELWAQLRNMARPNAACPADIVREGAKRRDELMAELEAAITDETERGKLQRRAQRVQEYVHVREERAMWQLIATGSLRAAVLTRGAALVEQGRIDQADDVLYLSPQEIEARADSSADLRRLVAERRAERQRWMRVKPPLHVGAEPAADLSASPWPDGTTPPPAATDDNVLNGVAGSRGVATGPARIVLDLADIDRVEPGDVLVCVMTSPPWTPAFALASALVTDSGDIGSHPAIAAREYGIPCVLATKIGTQRIPDGAMVTVDGAVGTVTIV